MLCEIEYITNSLLGTWMLATCASILLNFLISGPVFYFYYWPSQVSYVKWCYKSNVKFPTPEKVRDEIIAMMRGVISAAFCPALSIHLAMNGYSQGYCGWNGYSVGYHIATFFGIMFFSDLYEYMYHRLGHVSFRFWNFHKHHHIFYNPSPFAVVADEWVDQFLRTMPLLIIPLLVPVNMDMIFLLFALQFYMYGVYLHWGYEHPWLSAHNPILNTSFQHYCHHAKSLMNTPYHCGFHFKIWDQLFNTCYPEEKCFCAECSRKKGERTEDAFKKIQLPDYSQLLTPKLWLSYFDISY